LSENAIDALHAGELEVIGDDRWLLAHPWQDAISIVMSTDVRDMFTVAGLVAALALADVPAAGQSTLPSYNQTVVVTAAATPIELGSATRSLTVITREEIEALPARSVADVLRLAASVDVRARGEHGIQSDFAIRGAGFGQMLVLVDGVRLNDAQSGHHNGDIPVPLDVVDRIEIVYGPGSSLFGADAFGGTVNVITRRTSSEPSLSVQGGSFGYAASHGDVGFERGRLQQTIAGSAERSSGFMYDRDFRSAGIQARTTIRRSSVSLAVLDREFGANNFYGGNRPSREWTNQTLLTADRAFAARSGWRVGTRASYRTHGDHFVFDQLTPALSNNRHRTHEVLGALTALRSVRANASFAAGAEGGGNWIRSSNLGDHDMGRVSGFAEWRQTLAHRTQVDASIRADHYSEFGTAWSPSVGAGWWPASRLRLRASAGRAFRVPTFTERYYSDPANLARPDVEPETAWAGEGGADIFPANGWMLQATVFGRADRNVIDWLRATPLDRWRTYNVRQVSTKGIELAARRTFSGGAFAQLGYTGLDLDAAAVNQLSKYLLDYAPRSLTASGLVPVGGGVRVAPRMEYRRRSRSSGTSQYVILDLRVARRLGSMLDLVVDGTNLFDRRYQEIAGVDMPGAAMTVSLAVGRR
jgi:outer membrane cobalamin receptor